MDSRNVKIITVFVKVSTIASYKASEISGCR